MIRPLLLTASSDILQRREPSFNRLLSAITALLAVPFSSFVSTADMDCKLKIYFNRTTTVLLKDLSKVNLKTLRILN